MSGVSGGLQQSAWFLTLVLMAAIALVFGWVAARASAPQVDAAQVADPAYRWRARLFWLAVVAGVAIAVATLVPWPIAGHARSAAAADFTVRAVGHQWRWELSSPTVPAGKVVEFEVSASDVNHGFGIYRDGRLVAQTQAMPGFVNRLRVRFDEPGEYHVLCMEYCGVAHHGMRAVFNVVRP
jgi:cytochrome c oxidase subunit 2